MANDNNISFRCPVHQSPGAIAHSFMYEPYISLKIDGTFNEVSSNTYNTYFPIFPQSWTKIEGEMYEKPNEAPIFYVFYIQSSEKNFKNLSEMYKEIETYFLSQVSDKIMLNNFN